MERIIEVDDLEVTIKVSGRVKVETSKFYGANMDGKMGVPIAYSELIDPAKVIADAMKDRENQKSIEKAITEHALETV